MDSTELKLGLRIQRIMESVRKKMTMTQLDLQYFVSMDKRKPEAFKVGSLTKNQPMPVITWNYVGESSGGFFILYWAHFCFCFSLYLDSPSLPPI